MYCGSTFDKLAKLKSKRGILVSDTISGFQYFATCLISRYMQHACLTSKRATDSVHEHVKILFYTEHNPEPVSSVSINFVTSVFENSRINFNVNNLLRFVRDNILIDFQHLL